MPALRSLCCTLRCLKASTSGANVQGRCIDALQRLLQGHQAGDQGSLARGQIRQRLLPGGHPALLPGRLQLCKRGQDRHQGPCEPLPMPHQSQADTAFGNAACDAGLHLRPTPPETRRHQALGLPGARTCRGSSMLADSTEKHTAYAAGQACMMSKMGHCPAQHKSMQRPHMYEYSWEYSCDWQSSFLGLRVDTIFRMRR